jgi:hypothetical protein
MFAKGARVIAVALAIALGSATPAAAQAPFAPYDGSNPFNCQLQDVGTGTDFPDPDADPFCVKFDKTSQSLLPDLGLIDFLANEPTRVAAASPKCFYYQRDHWTGALVQGQPPELWNWVGSYFFDKAKGIGGVHVRDLRIAGQPFDATPYAPAEYQPYFEEGGGGGVMVTQVTEADPSCVAKAEEGDVYRDDPDFGDCIPPGGELQRRKVGRVRLGASPQRVRDRLGPPRSRKHNVDRWCVIGKANLRVAYRRGSERGAALIRTTSRGHAERGVGPGARRSRANRKLDLQPRFRLGDTMVAEAERRAGRRLFAGLRGKRVRWLAMIDPERLGTDEAIRRALRRAG